MNKQVIYNTIAIKSLTGGLGNSLFPLCKALIASESLETKLRIPPNFDSARKRVYFKPWSIGIAPEVNFLRKRVIFTYNDYLEMVRITQTYDYYDNIKEFVFQNDFHKIVLVHEGMWGGFKSIARSKKWVKGFLLSNSISRKNYSEIGFKLNPKKLTIAFHIRCGDFSNNNERENGSLWNARISLEWFINIGDSLKNKFGDNVQFILFSDGTYEELKEFIMRFSPIVTNQQKMNAYSDLLLMSETDLLICSTSSYSMWASFLSENPYVFYSPYMQEDSSGNVYFWDDPGEYEKLNTVRGFVANAEGDLTDNLIQQLAERLLALNSYRSELILGGKCPKSNHLQL